MITYIKYRLKLVENKSLREQKEVLEDIYKELESKGYNHLEIYAMVNKVIIENLKELNERLKNLLNEKEKK